MENVCAVIVTYQRLALLKKCIDALRKQECPCDLFVVDNHSSDGTQEYLVSQDIDHICLDENIGGAGGFNIGIRSAVEKGYEYIWIMDDDCIVHKDSLKKLLEAKEKVKRFGFLASRVLWKDGSLHAMNKIEPKKKEAYKHIYPIDQATFVSLLFSRETVLKCGLPIKDFFIWGDDIEYTRRIAVRYGIPSYYVYDSVVMHMTKTNIGSKIAFDDHNNLSRYRYAYRNENYLYRNEGLIGIMYYHAKCAYNLLRILFLSKDNKTERMKVLLSAMKEGYRFDPKQEFVQ